MILIKLVNGPRCQGCGSVSRLVDRKLQLCLYCLGLRLETNARKHKLDGTVRQRFATIAGKIKSQLAEFHTSS